MILNGAQFHLLLNHLPVLGYPIACLALIWGLAFKSESVKQFGFALTVLIGLGTLGAYFTGEGAEHVLKSIGEFPRSLVHAHEELAEKVTIASAFVSLLALAKLSPVSRRLFARMSSKTHQTLSLVLLVSLLAISAAFGWTAHLGGLIRHTEIRAESDTANSH